MLSRSFIAAALVLAVGTVAAANHRQSVPIPRPSPTSSPTLDPSKWNIRYSINMPSHPSAAPGGGFMLTFPVNGEIDYLTTSVRMKASVRARITLRVDVVNGVPTFLAHNDAGGYCTPAYVRIMLQKRNDDMRQADGRFWTSVAYQLAPGSSTMDIPLTDKSLWSNVYGQYATTRPSGFARLLADLGNVGVTFGGCGNYGHGVKTKDGTARLTVTEFIVQ